MGSGNSATHGSAATRLHVLNSGQAPRGGSPRAGLIDTEAVAQMIGIPTNTVRVMCREGRIPHYRFGYVYRFDPRRIREWIAEHEVVP